LRDNISFIERQAQYNKRVLLSVHIFVILFHNISSQELRFKAVVIFITQINFRPSTTSEPFRNAFDQEYRAAEIAGQRDANSCDNLFPECTESLLDYFTEILE